jgi:hypothetical protein
VSQIVLMQFEVEQSLALADDGDRTGLSPKRSPPIP